MSPKYILAFLLVVLLLTTTSYAQYKPPVPYPPGPYPPGYKPPGPYPPGYKPPGPYSPGSKPPPTEESSVELTGKHHGPKKGYPPVMDSAEDAYHKPPGKKYPPQKPPSSN